MSFRIDKCRTCGASVIWGETVTGVSMPVDAHSSPSGNVEISEPADPRDPPFVQVYGPKNQPTYVTRLHLSHFVTCPQSERHRRRK